MYDTYDTSRNLLSQVALHFLRVLTPERQPISRQVRDSAAVVELERLGLVAVDWTGDVLHIRLTAEGRRWRPAVNN